MTLPKIEDHLLPELKAIPDSRNRSCLQEHHTRARHLTDIITIVLYS